MCNQSIPRLMTQCFSLREPIHRFKLNLSVGKNLARLKINLRSFWITAVNFLLKMRQHKPLDIFIVLTHAHFFTNRNFFVKSFFCCLKIANNTSKQTASFNCQNSSSFLGRRLKAITHESVKRLYIST